MTTNPAGDPVLSADALLGAKIHQTMFLKRMSQTKLAPKIGISQSVLSKKLRGQVPWSVTELLYAANALGVDPGELLPKVDPKSATNAADALPRLDLNQQPFGYPTSQLTAVPDLPMVPELPLYPNVVPLRHGRPGDSQPATRQSPCHTFRPVILNFPNRVPA
ncbi:MAG TPA: helix-turn-helix transcriptional regulator [Propionibacteriaceae bacterium]|nr:helix-turn-helix transcriptional regulator [Propionibacteriaceae bacterium]